MDNVTATGAFQAAGPADLLRALGRALDGVSYQDLEGEHPAVADALHAVVDAGYAPDDVRRWALQYGMPAIWAAWLERAARYLEVEA